jgi:hypothetical protein
MGGVTIAGSPQALTVGDCGPQILGANSIGHQRHWAANSLFTFCGQPRVMRAARFALVPILPSLLCGCGADPVALVGTGVVSGVSLPVFHRTPVDMVVSAATGRDCSVVNLDKDERYCRPKDRPPVTPEFCTRSLGTPDCWDDPSKLLNHPHEIADGPRTLTEDQEADRKKRWPWLW